MTPLQRDFDRFVFRLKLIIEIGFEVVDVVVRLAYRGLYLKVGNVA